MMLFAFCKAQKKHIIGLQAHHQIVSVTNISSCMIYLPCVQLLSVRVHSK